MQELAQHHQKEVYGGRHGSKALYVGQTHGPIKYLGDGKYTISGAKRKLSNDTHLFMMDTQENTFLLSQGTEKSHFGEDRDCLYVLWVLRPDYTRDNVSHISFHDLSFDTGSVTGK